MSKVKIFTFGGWLGGKLDCSNLYQLRKCLCLKYYNFIFSLNVFFRNCNSLNCYCFNYLKVVKMFLEYDR